MNGEKAISENVGISPYFEFQSLWGFSKHGGGLKATEELIKLCKINRDKYVLDVGCGVGATSCFLWKKHECKVVGIDISEKMVEREGKGLREKA